MPAILMPFPWIEALILLPLAAGLVSFLWPRGAARVGLLVSFTNAVLVSGLLWQVLDSGVSRHPVGGWGVPLGIDLYVDGLAVLMLAATAVIGFGVSVYSAGYFKGHDSARFWPIWLFLLGALNALFVSADVFNLYVTLEIVGLATVSLAALSGGAEALRGAMRYLLATLLGSLLYLLGVALLYHSYGSVDIITLGIKAEPSAATWTAMALMSAGLMLKTALFPLHFWLPPAHAHAPAPVSALLSALVVKAPFYILARLWIEIFGPLFMDVATLFSLLGAAAVIWGSLQALRQSRLKLLVAYSTVAQVGYLFLAFPLVASGLMGLSAAVFLVLSHALAKAAMFMAAGSLLRFEGHDRIADLDRVAQRLPLTAGAFALAGVCIIGLPPSGAFVGKWLLLESAIQQGQWPIVLVIILGSLLAAAYIFKVVGYGFTKASVIDDVTEVPASMQWPALLLAIAALLLGLLAAPLLSLLGIGDLSGVSEISQ